MICRNIMFNGSNVEVKMFSRFLITFGCVLLTANATPTSVATPTVPTSEQCQNASNCEECVKIGSVQCVWCQSSKNCMIKHYVIPTSECSLSDAKWAVCWLNYEALIITCSVIGAVIILALAVCILYCCCCKKNNRAKYDSEDARIERNKQEMKTKHAERRAERNAKADEIRRKYGLLKEDGPKYSKLEDDGTSY